jgi:hypothetical protein
MTPKRIDREALAALLRNAAHAVERGDSFDGSIQWMLLEGADDFDVMAMIRVGNALGQGGMIVVGTP